ncbi:MAG: T9SS type A sorting domain-containing protein, partial [Bacteroidota bacterium]
NPSVSFNLIQDTLCVTDGLLQLSGGIPTGGNYSGIGVASNNFNPSTGAGSYQIIYTYVDSSSSCSSSVSQNLFVDNCLFVDYNLQSEISVYPNPVKNVLFIDNLMLGQSNLIELMDAQGKRIFKEKSEGVSSFIIDTEGFSNGVYLLKVNSLDKIASKRILIQH